MPQEALEGKGDVPQGEERTEGDITVQHRSLADFAPIAAKIDEVKAKVGLPKDGPGFFMGYVEGVGLVIDM